MMMSRKFYITRVPLASASVAETAVIGMPDEKMGERVTAFIVRRDPELTDADLDAWCRERLTHYKLPRSFIFRSDLPKTNVGKVLRRALREETASEVV